ncbi:efflux RND transporter permease subunit [Desulforhopalus singaporensis]|uniref:Multidrug efflux pump subunit AcrB n=1 Tax=Desulforhopalus singaporensis TaxID=91360 RepID=A0A1H0IXQ5_9BACT|nr:efflux RND transporter permease subunit [Desulforhopalus singaporensis]SDO36133.1 Multidrug efflux pump subunit AcrB [Desulforhopalus singaporensis]
MIAKFVGHPTAANLLMLIFLVMGLFSLPQIQRETFPDYSPDEVLITIVYPGAAAEEVEEVVCRRVEDALDSLTFVKEIRSEAREGLALTTVEMAEGGDLQVFMDEIDQLVKGVDDFPVEVETPVVTEVGKTDPVVSVIVSGPMSITDLKTYCEELKDRMQEEGISLIDIEGFSARRFRVEVSESGLQKLGMSVVELARVIGAQNIDLPAGSIETGQHDILLRFANHHQSVLGLEQLVIKTGSGAGEVLLGDVAKIHDTFELAEEKNMVNGRRSAMLNVMKTGDQDTIRIADRVKTFIAAEHQRHPQVELSITQDNSVILADRLRMLLVNGWEGLLLVFLVLWLFFNLRVSFWVVAGLPVSFLGAFFFLPYLGLTINMMTMVGLLLALGLLMDDAIVIAENIAVHRQRGKNALTAAVDGTREVAAGVASSFITTLCVLGPLAFIEGQIGKVLKVVPMILILVLAVSLVEAFCILPAHLSHSMDRYRQKSRKGLRQRFDSSIDWMREQLVGRTVDFVAAWRYLFVGCVAALFVVSVGLVASGKIKVIGFPEIEGDVVVARLLMGQGTPLEKTEATVNRILQGLAAMNDRFKKIQPKDQDLVVTAAVQFNKNDEAFEKGPHVATVTVDLLAAEKRVGRIDDYLAVWRKETGPLPDVVSLTMSEPGFGPAGRPIEIRLRGDDLDLMKKAAHQMQQWFAGFDGVLNLDDDLRPGKPEVKLRLKEGATALGVDAATLAGQLRAGFYGITADEIQVGDASYEVTVRFANQDRSSLDDLENYHVVVPGGDRIALANLADWEIDRGRARIARFNNMRAVTLRGDIDTRITNAKELLALFEQDFLSSFPDRYPGIGVTIGGETEESKKTQFSMVRALGVGLIGIFILLSFQFRSYMEPLVVMIAIPLSFIGVVWGHFLMGVVISMPSLLGFSALAGIVVNDSLLLVLFLKNGRSADISLVVAAGQASRSRFRAVLLTSATTIAGLLPLLFEKSLQAQILIPLVVSVVFGLVASTLLVLLVIPCLYLILSDFGLHEKKSADESFRLSGNGVE